MTIGYCRVSTKDQNLDRQIHALTKYGAKQIFQDKLSGKNADRPELKACLQILKAGDTLVVQKLDRLARSLKDLITIMEDLGERKINFVCIDNAIDTSTPAGKLMFQLVGAIAEFERSLIVSRVQDGIENAKRNGVRFGRKMKRDQSMMKDFYRSWAVGTSAKTLTETFPLSRRDVYRYISKFKTGVTVSDMYPQEEPKNVDNIFKEV